MAMLDSLIAGLADSPVVAKAMVQFTEVRDGIIVAMKHFNTRFDGLQNQIAVNDGKLDKLISLMEQRQDIVVPAAADGLMEILAEDGQEMIMQPAPEPIPVIHALKMG